ncbi:MAG: hypothetical protein P8Y70_02360 [Candidatus Lokiarchaeota archaeon]
MINWPDIERNPNSKQKVRGKILLDLRAKINDLEKDLVDYKHKNEKLKEELKKVQDINFEKRGEIEDKEDLLKEQLNKINNKEVLIQTLQDKVEKFQKDSKVLKKIINMMSFKGFVSDKELDTIFKKF